MCGVLFTLYLLQIGLFVKRGFKAVKPVGLFSMKCDGNY